VRKFCVYLFLLLFFFNNLSAQTTQDSVVSHDSATARPLNPAKDTSAKLEIPKKHVVHRKSDSLSKMAADSTHLNKKETVSVGSVHLLNLTDSSHSISEKSHAHFTAFSITKILSDNPYFNFLGESIRENVEIHMEESYDGMFYLLMGVLFYFALIKVVFGKYLSNLFSLYFRVSMRQQQIREQVLQAPLPSLLMNALYIIVVGLYGTFLTRFYHLAEKTDFGILFLNFAALLCIIYLVKFLLLKSLGWIFNIQRATDTYIFIVFLTNKILAIFLLPFLIMLSFSATLLNEIAVTLSLVMIIMFFLYRFIASYAPIRKEIKMNVFHFFLYICAFEIAPLLLIYRMLLAYLEKAY